jgi:hypothetical protein
MLFIPEVFFFDASVDSVAFSLFQLSMILPNENLSPLMIFSWNLVHTDLG